LSAGAFVRTRERAVCAPARRRPVEAMRGLAGAGRELEGGGRKGVYSRDTGRGDSGGGGGRREKGSIQ